MYSKYKRRVGGCVKGGEGRNFLLLIVQIGLTRPRENVQFEKANR